MSVASEVRPEAGRRAAVAPELDGHGGAYLADVEISDDDAPWTRDAESAARLWTLSEELVGQPFPAPE